MSDSSNTDAWSALEVGMGVFLIGILVLVFSTSFGKNNLETQRNTARAQVILLEQGFTMPRVQAGDILDNEFSVGFGSACRLTLQWDGSKTFSYTRFSVPASTSSYPVTKNVTYDKLRSLSELKQCGAKPHYNY